MKPEADDLTHLKMWAMALAVDASPTVRRRAMYRYLGTLYSLAIKANPSLKPLYGEPGMLMAKAIAEMQETLVQASNREVPQLFSDVFKATGKGRPPTARAELLCWASASAVITILMKEHGKTEKEAAQLVEKHLRKKGICVPGTHHGNEPAWKRLQSWRDKCLAGKKGKIAKGYYSDALVYRTFPPQDLIDFLLDPPFVAYEPMN